MNSENKSCNLFEKLFIEDEETLKEHIKNCPKCREEFEKMEKVSALIDEVSFTVRKKHVLQKQAISAAASFLAICLAFFAVQFSLPKGQEGGIIASAEDFSYEQMGLPVDEYGLIMVDFDK